MKPRLFPCGGVGIVVDSQALTLHPSCQTKKSIGFIWHVMNWDWYKTAFGEWLANAVWGEVTEKDVIAFRDKGGLH
jgi:hypothetical protein